MAKQEIVKDILETLNSAMRQFRFSEIAKDESLHDDYQKTLLWLNSKRLIEGAETKTLGNSYGNIVFARITPEGRDYLERGCMFEEQIVVVKLHEASAKLIREELVNRLGKSDAETFSFKKFLKTASDASINTLMTKGIEHILSNFNKLT